MKKKKITLITKIDPLPERGPKIHAERKTQGRKARAAGARFELRVRADLESKGWVVDKWSNNVEFNIEMQGISNQIIPDEVCVGKLVKVKNKFLGPGKPMMLGAGFPDFIAFKNFTSPEHTGKSLIAFEVIGVEVKSKGYLDKEEKEKCRWLIENNIFSKILVASKGKKRGEIKYQEVKNNGKKDV